MTLLLPNSRAGDASSTWSISAPKSTFRKRTTVLKVLPNIATGCLCKGGGGGGRVRVKRRVRTYIELLERISVVGNVCIFLLNCAVHFPAFIYSIGPIVITTGIIM